MTLEARITAAVQAIGADVKTLLAQDGNLSTLTTAAKDSLVAAINEIKAALATAGTPEVDDAAASNSTTKTYSATKITALLASLKTDILGGASAAYDTLIEIQNILQSDDTAISGLVTAVGNRVRFDAAQSLTPAQQIQARTNTGALSAVEIGDTDHNFVTDYTTAKT